MLDQLFRLVRQFGEDSVVKNQDVPNEHNEAILNDATKTIGAGFQNLMAGGGLSNILDLFRGGKSSQKSGMGGLLKNPIVSMMIGYFISKLISKYKMSPAAASNVSNQLIPNVLSSLVNRTTSHDPENDAFDFNDLIGSLTGGRVNTSESRSGGFNFQNLLDRFVGNGSADDNELEEANNQVTNGAREYQEEQNEKGGFFNILKNLFSAKS